jgi:beta-aspartyl-peptidase (threonine type)
VPNFSIAIHGGAGRLGVLEPRVRDAMRSALDDALRAAEAVLLASGPALDAVVAAVRSLEDAPCFNAGRGAVLRSDGSVRLDASIACGATRRAGAVTGARRVVHPVDLARHLLERSGPVLITGSRADELADELGLSLSDVSYLRTEHRLRQWQRAQATGSVHLDHDAVGDDEGQTVGAVARDAQGHLAAATSTGGLTNADPGRVGDSPVIGAGTWARDETCAVSATGTGESFLRSCFAHQVHARHLFANQPIEQAALAALDEVQSLGGEGGCVVVDREGNLALPFTTPAMPRAFRDSTGRRIVLLLAGEAEPG